MAEHLSCLILLHSLNRCQLSVASLDLRFHSLPLPIFISKLFSFLLLKKAHKNKALARHTDLLNSCINEMNWKSRGIHLFVCVCAKSVKWFTACDSNFESSSYLSAYFVRLFFLLHPLAHIHNNNNDDDDELHTQTYFISFSSCM